MSRSPARRAVPDATVARLPLYLRALVALAETGEETVSSESLAAAVGVTGAKVRKDLSQLGTFGTRGVGYDTAELTDSIASELGLSERREVVIVGIGNLGHALAGYAGFATRGFHICALLDADTGRIGEEVRGLRVESVDGLEDAVARYRASIGVIATSAESAQEVCDRLVAAGVTAILNFAPVVLSVPVGVDVRKVDLSVELQILSFHEQRKSQARGLATTAVPAVEVSPSIERPATTRAAVRA